MSKRETATTTRRETFANGSAGRIRRDTRRQARAAKHAFAFMGSIGDM